MGPSVLSWGFNLYLIYTEASLATVIFFTLSSSKTMAFSSSERFKGFSDTTTISASGWRFFKLPALRAERPFTTICITPSMPFSSSPSIKLSSASGKRQR